MSADNLSQVIDPPVGPDEGRTLTVTATGLASSPVALTAVFQCFRDPGQDPLVVTLAAPTVTGTAPSLTAVYTVPLTLAQVATLLPGLNTWVVRVTTTGQEAWLAGGTWLVLRE